jgi:hypothetical protein
MTILRLVGGSDVKPTAAPTGTEKPVPRRDRLFQRPEPPRNNDDAPLTEPPRTGGCARGATRFGEWPMRRHGIGECD